MGEDITLDEIGQRLIRASCYWDETYSITSECRMKAAITTYRYAERWMTLNDKDHMLRSMVDDAERLLYRHFEFGEPLPDFLEFDPLPSPSPGFDE